MRARAAKGPTFASALVVDGRYLCSCARVRACASRVSTGWQVGSGVWTWCVVVRGRRRRRRGVVASFAVSFRLRRGSCVVFGMLLCIAAHVRSAREHDSLVFMYFVPFWRVSCFVCMIVCARL